PATGKVIKVLGAVPPGTASVTILSTRPDNSGSTRKGATPDATTGNYSVDFTYTVKADESFPYAISFSIVECVKSAQVVYTRKPPTVKLRSDSNPLILPFDEGKNVATARMTLSITGVGNVTWTVLTDGNPTAVTGSSAASETE